jgi:hypothetical protein
MLLLQATENNDLPMLEYMLLHMYLRPPPFVPIDRGELTTLVHVACRQASVRVVALLAAFSDKNDEWDETNTPFNLARRGEGYDELTAFHLATMEEDAVAICSAEELVALHREATMPRNQAVS